MAFAAYLLACVASVSIWLRFWPREKWNKSQKNESGGRGKGRKETLADKPLDFENLRSIGLASRTMLTCVDQRFVSYWDDDMVRDTHINFQLLLF